MATPDVRVRLSAEGVAEVVAALKKVQSESEKTAGKQSRGFLGLNRVLGSTSALLGGLGVALGVHQFQQWIRSSVDAADRTLELSQAVGASTEHLSALHLVSRTAGVGLDQMGQALAKQNKFISEANEGNAKAVTTLRDLHLTIRDFKGKDSVQAFELLANRISALTSPIQKTQLAMEIFGRSGANLIPTMNALADEGLERVVERARELGVLIDTRLAAAADQLNDDFELLKAQSEGLGTRFAAGFVPQMSQALQSISGELKQTTKVWEDFGKVIGWVVKFVVALVSQAVDDIITYFRLAWIKIESFVSAAKALAHGHLADAKTAISEGNDKIEQELAAFHERSKARDKLAFSSPPPPKSRPETSPAGEPPEDPAELAAKRARAMRASLDRELALARSMASLRNAAEKRAFEEGLQSVQGYYEARRRIADEAFAKETETLAKQRALLSKEADPERRTQEEGKIDADLTTARLKHEEEIAALAAEEREAVRDLGRERLALEKSLLEAQGRRHEAALLGIDEEIQKADLLLRKQGVPDAEREDTLGRLRESLEAGVNFDEVKRQAEAVLSDLDDARGEIEARVSAGLLSQVEGEQQLLALEQDRLAALEELAAALERAALATGDPELIAQAKAYAAAIRDQGVAVAGAKTSFDSFKNTAIDAGRDALTEFFDTGIAGAKSFKDAFRDMALAVIGALKSLAAQLLATMIMKKIAGVFGMGGMVGGEGAAKKAEGGLLAGRGTDTSDSNLAWFSRGEYLVRAAVVREPGVLRHLEDLNRRGLRALVSAPVLVEAPAPRFADGGLVDFARPTASPASGRPDSLVVGLEEGLILRNLDTPTGRKILVRMLSKTRRGASAALGS
jgi:hypothetical protein